MKNSKFNNQKEIGQDFLEQIVQYPKLSKDEETNYINLLNNGNPKEVELAKDVLLKANLSTVVAAARKFQTEGCELEDLIQEGCEGLLVAMPKFDVSYGKRLAAYASFWIMQKIQRYLYDNGLIRIPVHLNESMNKYFKEKEEFYNKNGEEPSAEEIAKLLGITIEEVEKIQKFSKIQFVPLENNEPESIEQIEEDAAVKIRNKILRKMLKTLPERTQDIIKMRYGFDGLDIHTLEEIAQKYNVTRERVRQVEGKALRMLRHPSRSKEILEFVA